MDSEGANTDVLQGSIKSASYHIILQISFRVVTFLLNALVLHNVDKAVLGILNVRLMLLVTTILFVSRESFRKACLSKTRDHNWPQVINLLWLTVPNVICWSFTFCYIWLHVLELPSEEHVADYQLTVYVVGISCVIESFMEPVYLFSQAFLYVKFRLFVDCIMLAARVGILVVIVLHYPSYTIKSFAYGQATASTILLVAYWAYFWYQFRQKAILMKNRELHQNNPLLALPFNSLKDFLPRKLEGQAFIGAEMTLLTWGFFKQGILKQVLTEGERYIMTVFSVLTFTEQGVYDVVNNLGSMAARFIFMPIEESFYVYFAQMTNRQLPIEQQPQKEIEQVSSVLRRLLRSLSLLGLIIAVFGFSYSHLLLRLYGGSTLSDGSGPLLLRTHSLCIWFLAINGVTEAYVSAAMTSKQLDKYNRLMVALSIIFLGSAWLLSSLLGSVGFILANIINMSLRIMHSASFINGQYRKLSLNPLGGMIPFKQELAALLVAFAVTTTSSWMVYPTSAVLHFGIGAVSGLLVLRTIIYTDPELMYLIVSIIKKRFGKTD